MIGLALGAFGMSDSAMAEMLLWRGVRDTSIGFRRFVCANKKLDMNTKSLCICIVLMAACSTAVADRPSSNLPLVHASQSGSFYARSVPAKDDSFGERGKTEIFRVGADQDVLVSEYDWYARTLYILGRIDHPTIVRFGHAQNGREPGSDYLAIGIYRNGERVREYSTLEMYQLGSGVWRSVSNHRVLDSRSVRRVEGQNVFAVDSPSGKVFVFDLETGAIVEDAADQVSARPAGQSAALGAFERRLTSILRDIQTLQVGMTREDLLKKFRPEGGLSTRFQRRYVYGESPYIKVDVKFEPVGAPEDRLAEALEDKIIEISKPFLQWTIID
jgi:hypothetical protein